jgi:hypothetical protein
VQSSNSTLIANRKLVLHLLLVCLCQQLYSDSGMLFHYSFSFHRILDLIVYKEQIERNGWLDAFVRSDNQRAKITLFSLINTSLNYDPVGWGLPYNYLLFEDTQEEIVDISLHLLAVILNYTNNDNIFLLHLQEITASSDFTFLYKGLSTLLNNPIYAKSSYLPASTKEIGCYQEQLLLFWALITHNKVCSTKFN